VCERVAMAPQTSTPDAPWWQQRSPSLMVFIALFVVLAGATVVVAGQVADVLPEVPKDQLGQDRWADPIGVERNPAVQIGRIPDCAAGAVTRIVLWDEDSEPYWEVTGPPTPMAAFYVGVLPPGFTEVEPFREPPEDALVRLVVFRRVGGAAGMRYKSSQLRTGYVMAGRPLTSYTVEGFQTAEVCGGAPDTVRDDGTGSGTDAAGDGSTTATTADATTTTVPG
jgi:hypothetical protein